MTTLLVAKQYMKLFYSKYEIYITPFLKFLLAFTALRLINSRLGYMAAVNRLPIVLIVALMCSFMPTNFIVIMAALFILLHLYAFSLECTIVIGAAFLLMFLLYFRFSPKDTAAGLFCSENTVCDPDLHGTDRYTDIGSIRSMRHNCILYDPLCECKRFFIKRNDRRRDGGEIQDCHRRHFE